MAEYRTPEQKAEILAYAHGHSDKEAAEQFGVSTQTVHTLRYELKKHQRREQATTNGEALPAGYKARVVRQLRAGRDPDEIIERIKGPHVERKIMLAWRREAKDTKPHKGAKANGNGRHLPVVAANTRIEVEQLPPEVRRAFNASPEKVLDRLEGLEFLIAFLRR